jgi:hypothetical protein
MASANGDVVALIMVLLPFRLNTPKLSGDASVAIFERGISAEVDTQNLKRHVVAFIFEAVSACAGANLDGTTFDKVEIVE